jgi:hypothetical protein
MWSRREFLGGTLAAGLTLSASRQGLSETDRAGAWAAPSWRGSDRA